MGRFKTAIWSAKKSKYVKRTTDRANKKRFLADWDKGSWYDKINLSGGTFEELFSVETDEEIYNNEETEEIHWVKPSASFCLVDQRILESNMQAAPTCTHPSFFICLTIFCNFDGAMIAVAYQMNLEMICSVTSRVWRSFWIYCQ